MSKRVKWNHYYELFDSELKDIIRKNMSLHYQRHYFVEQIVATNNGKWIIKLKRK